MREGRINNRETNERKFPPYQTYDSIKLTRHTEKEVTATNNTETFTPIIIYQEMLLE